MPAVSKLSSKVQKAICADLEIAVPLKYAAEAAGISEATVYVWLQKGRDGESPYDDFLAAVEIAQAKAVPKLHRKALAGGKGSHLAVWFLEKRFREHYGPPKVEGDGSKIELTIVNDPPRRPES